MLKRWLNTLATHFTIVDRPIPIHVGSGRNFIHAVRIRHNRPAWAVWLEGYLRKHYG